MKKPNWFKLIYKILLIWSIMSYAWVAWDWWIQMFEADTKLLIAKILFWTWITFFILSYMHDKK